MMLGHSTMEMVKNYLALAQADLEKNHKLASPSHLARRSEELPAYNDPGAGACLVALHPPIYEPG